MPKCTDRADFERKIEHSNGLNFNDFNVMRCIPENRFEFYNVAGTSEQNSITLIFEECGGKYQKPKPLPVVESLTPVEVEWTWEKADCDEATEDCGYGLEEPPPEIINDENVAYVPVPEETKIVYEDCSDTSPELDEDCVEYWDI